MTFPKKIKDAASRLTDGIKRTLYRTRDHLGGAPYHGDVPAENAAEKALIDNITDFSGLTAEDVMVPRIDIVAIDVQAGPDEFLELIRTTPHSRIPVYQNELDEIVGFIHIKDILRLMAQGEPLVLRNLLRQALIVSPALRAVDLLLQMQQSKKHLAIVIDEYGGVDGLVSMSDLMEAIVGEISDEHYTSADARLFEKADGTVLVDARYSIEAFEEKYGELFAENERNEADTLGGLAMFIAGHLPTRGELLTHASGVQLEITDADPRRVKRLRIRNLPHRRPEPAAPTPAETPAGPNTARAEPDRGPDSQDRLG